MHRVILTDPSSGMSLCGQANHCAVILMFHVILVFFILVGVVWLCVWVELLACCAACLSHSLTESAQNRGTPGC
jgi:hypothetical protein